MGKIAIIKQTFRELLSQPIILGVIGIQVVSVLVLIFGVHLIYDQGTLISAKIFGSELEEGVALNLLNSISSLILFFIILLLVIGSSPIFAEFLRDPFIEIIFTKPISKTNVFLQKFLGVNLFALFDFLTFGSLITFVLIFKTGGAFIINPIVALLCQFLMLLFMSSVAAILGVIFENGTVAIGFNVVLLFLGAYLDSLKRSGILILSQISYLLPPFQKVTEVTGDVIKYSLSDVDIPLIPLVATFVIYSSIYFIVSLILFRRKEI